MCLLGLGENSCRKSWLDSEGRRTSEKHHGMQHNHEDSDKGLLETLEISALSKLGKHNLCAPGLLLGALHGQLPWKVLSVAVSAERLGLISACCSTSGWEKLLDTQTGNCP